MKRRRCRRRLDGSPRMCRKAAPWTAGSGGHPAGTIRHLRVGSAHRFTRGVGQPRYL